MRIEKSLSQKFKESAAKEARGEHVTIEDKFNFDAYNDPVHLAKELNREVSEMRDEVNHTLGQIKTALIIIAVILVAILIFKP